VPRKQPLSLAQHAELTRALAGLRADVAAQQARLGETYTVGTRQIKALRRAAAALDSALRALQAAQQREHPRLTRPRRVTRPR
jgi:hypothetical protein